MWVLRSTRRDHILWQDVGMAPGLGRGTLRRGWLLPALVGCVLLSGRLQAAESTLVPGAHFSAVDYLYWTARIIEAVGVTIIVVGAVTATLYFVWRAVREGTLDATYREYRANLGRGILLGLEFLVAADIIGTVAVDPTLQSLAVLAGIVVIRTFLSFSLEVEIEGRWPWQRGRPDKPA